ncbi:MAG: metal-dependent hydrolase [Haloferacaceae archaeon]
MLPWGHVAVGYLAYRSLRTVRGRGVPSPAAAVAVVVGTQAPDLIDKPLAWNLGLLPAGRSLGHSLLVMAVVFALASRLRVVRDRPVAAGAFALGAVSHAFADAAGPLVEGTPAAASFLLWPVVPLHVHDSGYSILAVFLSLDPTPHVLVGLVLSAVAAVVWVRDGTPGTGLVVRALRSDRRGRTEQ